MRRAAQLCLLLCLLGLPSTAPRKARKARSRPAPTVSEMRRLTEAVARSCTETMTTPPKACIEACTALTDAGEQAAGSPMGVSCVGLLGNFLYQTEVAEKPWEGEGTPKQQAFLRYYSRLLDTHPEQAGAVLQQAQMHVVLGDVYRVQEEFELAYKQFDAASAKLAIDDPRGVSKEPVRTGLIAHIRHEQLLCLTYEGKYTEALPLYVDVYRSKHGPAWSADRSEPIDSSLVSYEVKSMTQGIDDPTVLSRYKIMHDIEQVEHLAAKGAIPAEVAQLAGDDLRTAYRMTAGHQDDSLPFKAPASLINTINSNIFYLNRNLYEPHAELLKKQPVAVNPTLDVAKIEADYHDNGVGMTYIDDFVTPEALVAGCNINGHLLGGIFHCKCRDNGEMPLKNDDFLLKNGRISFAIRGKYPYLLRRRDHLARDKGRLLGSMDGRRLAHNQPFFGVKATIL